MWMNVHGRRSVQSVLRRVIHRRAHKTEMPMMISTLSLSSSKEKLVCRQREEWMILLERKKRVWVTCSIQHTGRRSTGNRIIDNWRSPQPRHDTTHSMILLHCSEFFQKGLASSVFRGCACIPLCFTMAKEMSLHPEYMYVLLVQISIRADTEVRSHGAAPDHPHTLLTATAVLLRHFIIFILFLFLFYFAEFWVLSSLFQAWSGVGTGRKSSYCQVPPADEGWEPWEGRTRWHEDF